MAKLKGVKRIDRIINEFVEQFGLTAGLDKDFGYYRDGFHIGYSLVATNAEADEYLTAFCNHLNPDIKADIFLISLFHEIGHHFTQFNFSEADWDKSDEVKDHIETAYGRYPKKAAKWNNIYFNLNVEKAATEWGLNYMQTHIDEVNAFWTELQPAIMRFYRKNNVKL